MSLRPPSDDCVEVEAFLEFDEDFECTPWPLPEIMEAGHCQVGAYSDREGRMDKLSMVSFLEIV